MGSMLQDFILEMRNRYTPRIPAANGSLQGGAPVNGIRFTGNGPTNKIAGVVEGGEQVIEAPMVRSAGGPGKIRETVEELATRNPRKRNGMTKIPQETPNITPPRSFCGGTGRRLVPSFQGGTGTGTVDDSITKPLQINLGLGKMPATQAESDAAAAPRQFTSAGTTGLVSMPTTKTESDAAIVTPKVTVPPVFTSAFPGVDAAGLVKQGAENLQDVAAGKDEGFKKLSDITRLNLAGQQSTDIMKQAQAIAQSQKTGGEAAAAQARLQREQGIERAGMETEILKTSVAREDQANQALLSLGLNVAGIEQAQTESDRNYALAVDSFKWGQERWGAEFRLTERQFGLTEDQFKEFKSQYLQNHDLDIQRLGLDERQVDLAWADFGDNRLYRGLDYAIRKLNSDLGVSTGKYTLAITNKDWGGAAAALNEMGLTTTAEQLAANARPGEIGAALGDFASDISLLVPAEGQSSANIKTFDDFKTVYGDGFEDTLAYQDLQALYKAQTGKEATGTDFQNWAVSTFKGVQYQNDPIKMSLDGLSDADIDARLEGMTGRDVGADFKYISDEETLTGATAARRAYYDVLTTGGATIVNGQTLYNPTAQVFEDMENTDITIGDAKLNTTFSTQENSNLPGIPEFQGATGMDSAKKWALENGFQLKENTPGSGAFYPVDKKGDNIGLTLNGVKYDFIYFKSVSDGKQNYTFYIKGAPAGSGEYITLAKYEPPVPI